MSIFHAIPRGRVLKAFLRECLRSSRADEATGDVNETRVLYDSPVHLHKLPDELQYRELSASIKLTAEINKRRRLDYPEQEDATDDTPNDDGEGGFTGAYKHVTLDVQFVVHDDLQLFRRSVTAAQETRDSAWDWLKQSICTEKQSVDLLEASFRTTIVGGEDPRDEHSHSLACLLPNGRFMRIDVSSCVQEELKHAQWPGSYCIPVHTQT